MESLQLDLGLKPVLSLHHYVNHFEPVIVPFLDAPEVSGSALVIDNKGHNAMAQALLEHDQSANAAVLVLKGEDLLEAYMKVQDLIPFDFGLVLIVPDQFRQTGIDSAYRQQLPISGTGSHSPVLTRADLLTVGIHRAGHQDLMEFPDELLGQGLHHMVQDVVDAMDVVQDLDHIGHLHRLEGLPDLALPEDGFHLLTGQSAAGHPGRRVSKVDHHKIVQYVKIPLFLLILQLFSQFRQLGFFCILLLSRWTVRR